MIDDALFSYVEMLQGTEPWGNVLDAGTGRHSLGWLLRLPTARLTAVTAEPWEARALERDFSGRLRTQDRLVLGTWSDPALLRGEVFDVVVADYLLGALDRHAPFVQEALFERLRPHVGSRLYVVGLEPEPAAPDSPWGKLILETVRLRDAAILLSGDRCHREYPRWWARRSLERNGFEVTHERIFPIRYGVDFIHGQLDVALRKLPAVPDKDLARNIERAADSIRRRAVAFHEKHGSIPFGEDFVLGARPESARARTTRETGLAIASGVPWAPLGRPPEALWSQE